MQALTSHDSTRTRIWFPMFSYFESSVDGIIPNEYTSFENISNDFVGCIVRGRNYVILTVRRCWGAQQQYVSAEFLRKICNTKLQNIVEETTAAMTANVPPSLPLPASKPLKTSAKGHQLTLDPTKIPTATLETTKLHQNNEFANNLDNHLRRFDKQLITDGDTFVLNYRGEVNKKVI